MLTVASAVDAARAMIQGFGKAEVGDKTLVDALVPFVERLQEQRALTGQPLIEAWQGAAEAATTAAAGTSDLKPRLGRARPHVEASLGTPDPGAVSFALAVSTAGQTLSGISGKEQS